MPRGLRGIGAKASKAEAGKEVTGIRCANTSPFVSGKL
jgi:hypothetical protein